MKIFNLFFFVIICFSCNKEANIVRLTKSISIEVKLLPNEDFSFHQYITINENEYIICLRKTIPPALSFYNIKSGEPEISIPLTSVPDFSVRWYYAYVLNVDSIFILNSLNNELLLLDKNGNIKINWHYKTAQNKDDYGLLSEASFPLVLFKNRFYCNSVRKDMRLINKSALKNYYNSPTNFVFKTIADSLYVINHYGKFPDSYSEKIKNFYDYIPSRTINSNSEVILSFGKEHKLIVYSGHGDFIKEINSKSKYIDAFTEIDEKKTEDFSYLKKYLAIEPKYEKIIFDPYLNLYYRIVKHRITDYENNDGTVKSIEDSKYSVIILDMNFNILDEIIFENNKYVVSALIPSENGILIPTMEKSHTNEVKFDLFMVDKK